MDKTNFVLLIGIGLWFISRVRTRTWKQKNNKNGTLKLKKWERLLIGAELFTIFIVWIQLYIYPVKCQVLAGLQIPGLILFFLGIFMALLARHTLKENWHTARDFAQPKRLVDSGIYRYIRHPIYFGSLLMGLGFELSIGSWLFFIVLVIGTPFIYKCSYKEEQLLKKWFGQEYLDYKKITNWFFPGIF